MERMWRHRGSAFIGKHLTTRCNLRKGGKMVATAGEDGDGFGGGGARVPEAFTVVIGGFFMINPSPKG
jgi:hypothetical protein